MRGSQLRELRSNSGIYQVELAEELGVHRNRIWTWEHNDEQLPKWAETLINQYLVNESWLTGMKMVRRAKRRAVKELRAV